MIQRQNAQLCCTHCRKKNKNFYMRPPTDTFCLGTLRMKERMRQDKNKIRKYVQFVFTFINVTHAY